MKPWVPCDFCRRPGFRYPVPLDIEYVTEGLRLGWLKENTDIKVGMTMPRIVQACDEHKTIVLLRAEEQYRPRSAAFRDGRPNKGD